MSGNTLVVFTVCLLLVGCDTAGPGNQDAALVDMGPADNSKDRPAADGAIPRTTTAAVCT